MEQDKAVETVKFAARCMVGYAKELQDYIQSEDYGKAAVLCSLLSSMAEKTGPIVTGMGVGQVLEFIMTGESDDISPTFAAGREESQLLLSYFDE